MEEYNNSLETTYYCEVATKQDAERIAELSNRTNQFNLADTRYSEEKYVITGIIGIYRPTEKNERFRNLVTGKQPEMNICNLLFEHKCFYLLSKCKSYNIVIQRKNVDIDKHIMEKEGFIQGRVTLKEIEPFSLFGKGNHE